MSTVAIVLIVIATLIAVTLWITARRRAHAPQRDDRRDATGQSDRATAQRLMARHEAARARAHAERAAGIDPDVKAHTPGR